MNSQTKQKKKGIRIGAHGKNQSSGEPFSFAVKRIAPAR
jgi:hypothetical protein